MSAQPAAATKSDERVVDLRAVETRFGDHVVHKGVDLSVRRGEIFALIGGSGSGKSTLLREMILLHQPSAGSIHVLGQDLLNIGDDDAQALRQRWGVMFQHGGLFGALTVIENIGLPLREHTGLDNRLIDDIAHWKLAMTGLKPSVGAQYPAELSGGMMKRASLARALSLDPELLFLDEPTAGLYPQSAGGVDEPILRLPSTFGLTMFTKTLHCEEVMQRIYEAFQEKVFHTVISRSIKLPDSTVAAAPITFYSPGHKTSTEYREVARELVAEGIVA